MLKAYKVSCHSMDYHGQQVVFAESARDARQRDPRDFCDCGYINTTAVRAREFDELAPGPIKTSDYLARDWYFSCSLCNKNLYQDNNPLFIDGDECSQMFCNVDCATQKLTEYLDMGPKVHESILSGIAEIRNILAVAKGAR